MKDRAYTEDTPAKVGEKVRLFGWAESVRDHGKITFIDLRDKTGIVQCVAQDAGKISVESVISVEGLVKKRPQNLVNKKIPTGEVEVEVKKLEIISKSDEMPFPIDTNGLEIDEGVRLKYRYLDLRRKRMTQNIRIRFKTLQFIRNWLEKRGFVEIETPILTKTTPEGARDFLVPSRLQPGKFYALPQSPQQYKQLLMVAGFEKYFQIARCFRDEDPRADRAYGEFTQLDIEMSFVDQNDILELTEKLFCDLVDNVFPEKRISKRPWPRIPHKEALEKYGSDKPDLRENKADPDELAFCWVIDFPLFNRQTKEDFFYGSGKSEWAPSHHMFTAPHPEDIPLLDKDPGKVRGLQHDLVLNGFEVGGGSVRIHQPEIQNKVFDLIGFTQEQKKEFEHMLTAFRYGVPPHGGIAPGVDRLLMAILGEPSVREVMAFPMTSNGTTAVLDAPSKPEKSQLKELKIEAKE